MEHTDHSPNGHDQASVTPALTIEELDFIGERLSHKGAWLEHETLLRLFALARFGRVALDHRAEQATPAPRRAWRLKLAGSLIAAAITIGAAVSSIVSTGVAWRQMRALEKIESRIGTIGGGK